MNKGKKNISSSKNNSSKTAPDSPEKRSFFGGPFLTIIFSALTALIVGAVGCFLVAVYLINPQTGADVKVADYNWGNANLVIRNPKEVVVNQDQKAEESIAAVSASMVKFYPRLQSADKDSVAKNLDASKFYLLKEPFSSGVIMSADGWILALWPGNQKSIDPKKIISDYDALDSEGKVYHVDQAIFADRTANEKNYQEAMPVLVHLASAGSLSVLNLAKPADLKIGQALFSYDGGHSVDFGFLADREKDSLLRSSEDSSESLVLDLNAGVSTKPSFVFNLAGDLLAWQTSSGKIFPIYPLNARLRSLFKMNQISEPYFGVNYYNLADLRIPGFNQDAGALIYSGAKNEAVVKGSPAEKAGLKKGDLILAVNGETISGEDDLSAIIQNYLPGQSLLISYSRSGVNAEASVKLGALK